MDTNKLLLSVEAKRKYLERLIGKMIKILHLIEEEKQTKNSPRAFIFGQLCEVNSANILFDNDLVEIIVKLNWVYYNYETEDFKEVRRQIFEIKNNINYILKNL